MHARRVLTGSGLFVVALIAVATLSGCSNAGSGGERLSKRRFINSADKICEEANKKIFAIGAPDLTDPEATSGAIGRLIAIQRRELRDLRDLEPPGIDKPAVNQWLDLVARALRNAEAALAALERGDRGGVNDANTSGREAQLEADDLAREYGVNGCVNQAAEPPPTSAP